MEEDIDNVDVIPSLKSDHSAIVPFLNGMENGPRGPSYWKLNSSLLDDKEYMPLINTKYPLWNDEFKEVKDPKLFWDLMKYKIRQESIFYSKKGQIGAKLKNINFRVKTQQLPKNLSSRSLTRKYEYV